ncbi:MAG TPA: enoyl-CoA hydratase [Natronosporangium sp.]|nr:enoyl-CoA hydratase [Natronosporangium sp.]
MSERSTVSLTTGDHPGVRILTLTDPDRRNAIGPQMRDELAAAVAEVAADPDARALVVAGAGSAFCAGADLPAVFGGPERPEAEIRRDLQRLYRSFLAVAELSIPTIAAVQGPAVGAGLNLAMCCDLRIAGPEAVFAATFTKLGLHPGGGCTYFLVRALGRQRALEVLLDGGSLTAEQAVARGLALRIEDDPLAAAVAQATRYAALDPELVRDIKRATQLAETAGFEASLEFESWAQASTTTKPAIREAIARLIGRRR